ncbi:hypothetical protein ACXHXM_34220
MCNSFMSCMADTNFVIGMVTIAAAVGAVAVASMLVWFEVEDFIEARKK